MKGKEKRKERKVKVKGNYIARLPLDVNYNIPPGTKVVIGPNVPIRNGHLLLEPRIVKVVGGHVKQLVDSWQVAQDVEKSRLLWKTEGKKLGEVDRVVYPIPG